MHKIKLYLKYKLKAAGVLSLIQETLNTDVEFPHRGEDVIKSHCGGYLHKTGVTSSNWRGGMMTSLFHLYLSQPEGDTSLNAVWHPLAPSWVPHDLMLWWHHGVNHLHNHRSLMKKKKKGDVSVGVCVLYLFCMSGESECVPWQWMSPAAVSLLEDYCWWFEVRHRLCPGQ